MGLRGFGAALLLLPVAAVSAARGEGAAGALPDAGSVLDAADAGQAPADPCAAVEERIARRKRWLAARRQEQFARGGAPDLSRGILNATRIWCEEHPDDEECHLEQPAAHFDAAELEWAADKTPEDYAPEVVLLRRELTRCRERARWRW